MSDTKAQTVAAELRQAAARAREHLLAHVTADVLPQTAIVTLCGAHEESEAICRNCVHFDVRDRVLARLVATLLNAREPLAAWLESWGGVELREDGPLPEDFQHALRVARVINGGS